MRPKFEIWITIYLVITVAYGYYLIRQMIGE